MYNKYIFSERSEDRMRGLHPKLIKTAERALSYGILDLTVPQYGGLRTTNEQKRLVKIGASKTMNSKHLVQSDNYAHAIDLAPYPIDWANIEKFQVMATLMFKASSEEGLVLNWGGHWPRFKDYCHFEISRVL